MTVEIDFRLVCGRCQRPFRHRAETRKESLTRLDVDTLRGDARREGWKRCTPAGFEPDLTDLCPACVEKLATERRRKLKTAATFTRRYEP